LGKSRMNFNRGEQKRNPEEDEEDFDWRSELAKEKAEDRKFEKQTKDWQDGEDLAREADSMEGTE